MNYLIGFGIVAFIMIGVNEMSAYGIFAYVLLMPLAYWLLTKAFENVKSDE